MSRHERVPNANNPRLLFRLLEQVATGQRQARQLADDLGVETRTVQYYTQAAQWLGLMEPGRSLALTPLGLEWVYAEPDQRARVYARAVWSQPLVRTLMAGQGIRLHTNDDLAAALLEVDPELAPATALRRATAVRGLVEPALAHRDVALPRPTQLGLPFGDARESNPEAVPQVTIRGDAADALDTYCVVHAALLDHGELALGQLRALLDAAGARTLSVGLFVDLLLRRGDALRIQERLVATAGAVKRRELAATAVGVALTDPGYRGYLTVLRAAARADGEAMERYGRLRERYAAWDRRIFGDAVSPARLAQDLDRILMGRSIDHFPEAGDPGVTPAAGGGPFLDELDRTGLAVSLPPSLLVLLGGVTTVNRLLEQERAGQMEVRRPRVTDRRVAVHGGLLYPGEEPLRAVADGVSLRLRVLRHVPHLALTTALLLLHRRPSRRVAVVEGLGGWRVHRRGSDRGELLELLDSFCVHAGWLPVRRFRGAVDAEAVGRLLVALGVGVRVGRLLVLEEGFFMRLRAEPEDRALYDRLASLEERLGAFLDGESA